MTTTEKRLPYPGLRSYESEESDLFFGREGCVDEMLEKLAATRFLAVLGTSGSGKSSLVRTGLLDALELGFLPGASSRWRVADMHPGGRPIRNLGRALVELEAGDGGAVEFSLMQSFLERGPRSVKQWCDDGNLEEGENLLILVDQFEELFRYRDYAGREEAEALVALLLESARAHPRIYVVITMRSEYLGACAMMPGLAEQINSGLYLTRRMTRAECQQAIEGPANVIGFDVEPRLVTQILNDLASFAPWDKEDALSSLEQLSRRADQLPLMQHVLNRLYQRAQTSDTPSVLTYSDYQIMGGLRGAIDAHAAEVVASLSNEARPLVEPVFRGLVSGSMLSNAVRDPNSFAGLVELAGGNEAGVREVVESFRARGCSFLRPPQSIALEPETIVDLSHESLIRQWSDLGAWLSEEARDASTWARIVAAQEAYLAGEGDLLSGLDLANAHAWWNAAAPNAAWARRHGGDFEAVSAYLNESVRVDDLAKSEVEAAEKARVRNLRIRAAAYLVLAIISVGAAYFGLTSRNEALHARNEALAARNEAVLATERAEEARVKAEAATESAENSLRAVQQANKLAIEASETFLIGLAERLRKSFGVRPEEVETMLGEGTQFLDRLEAQMPGNETLRHARAKLLLEFSEVYYGRSEFEKVGEFAEMTRTLLGAEDGSELAPEDAAILIRAEAIDSHRYRKMDRSEDAVAHAERADALLRLHAGHLPEDLLLPARADVFRALSTALAEAGRIDEAIDIGRECLSIGGEDNIDRRVLSARAYCASVLVWSENKRPGQFASKQYRADAEKHLEALAETDRDISDWGVWADTYGNIAYAQAKEGDYSLARQTFQHLISRLDVLIAAAPFADQYRIDRAEANNGLSYVLSRLGETEKAIESALATLTDYEGLGGRIWQSSEFAESYRDALSDAHASLLQRTNWRKDPEQLDTALEVTQKWFTHAKRMKEAGFDICEGCELIPASFLTDVHEAMLSSGRKEVVGVMFENFDHVRTAVERLAPELESKTAGIQARRALYWIANELPSAETHRKAFDDPAGAIAMFEQSTERLEFMIARYPEARYLVDRAARAYTELAQLYHEAGRPRDAETAIARGAELEGFGAIKLLQQWARNGDGPIGRNPEIADRMSVLLAGREWTAQSFEVLVDYLWTVEKEQATSRLFVFDVPHGEGSALDIALEEMRNMKGLEVSAESLLRLRKIETAAANASETFLRHASRSQGAKTSDDPKTAAEIEARLRVLAEEKETVEAAIVIGRANNTSGRREELITALGELMSNETETGFADLVNFMIDAASTLARSNVNEPAVTVFDAILERAELFPVPRHAAILKYRAELHSRLGNTDQEVKDGLVALALQPDNISLMNRVGYNWTQKDNMLPAAISVLERAVRLQPEGLADRHFVLDSLGWAYVLDGQIERGLALMEEAFETGDDDQAEIMYHIAEAYRRRPDENKALAAYLLARYLKGSTTIIDDINAGLNRMGYFPDHGKEEIDAAQAAQAALIRAGTHEALSVDTAGVAMQGYDPVALHDSGELRAGQLTNWAVWNGGLWLFSSERTKALFEEDPARYAPAFGGFCAECVSVGHKVPADPKYWAIQHGRLYLHASEQLRSTWARSPETRIAEAEKNWIGLKDDAFSRSAGSVDSRLLNALAAGAQVRGNDVFATMDGHEEVEAARRMAQAMRGLSMPPRINAGRDFIAIEGYDPVAYHTVGKATRGSLEHWMMWRDAVWLFETVEHRDMFAANPEGFAPAFGGFCGNCLAGGTKTYGNPRYWAITDGVVYLQSSSSSLSAWNNAPEAKAEAARAAWPARAGEPPSGTAITSHFAGLLDAIHRGAEIRVVAD